MKKTERPPLSSSLAQKVETVGDEKRYTPQPRIKSKAREKGQTNMTFFMSISTHSALKELAHTRGLSLQQLVAEFVDKGLAEAGEAAFKVKDGPQ